LAGPENTKIFAGFFLRVHSHAENWRDLKTQNFSWILFEGGASWLMQKIGGI
jgi:hypothetical protein